MRSILILTASLCLLLNTSVAHSQIVADLAARLLAEREKLVRYIVDVRCVGNYDFTHATNRADKFDFVIDFHIEHSKLDNHALHARRIKGPGLRDSWYLVGESDGVSFVKQSSVLKVGEAKLTPLDSEEYPGRCIDPRAIGFMFPHDISAKISIETILGKQLGNREAVSREGNLLKYKSRSQLFVFDEKQDCWPIEVEHKSAGRRLHWKTELKQIEGLFLPVKSSLEIDVEPGDTRNLEFTLSWISVNEPFSVGLLAEERLREIVE